MNTEKFRNLPWIKPLMVVGNIEWRNIAPNSNYKVLHAYAKLAEFLIPESLKARWSDKNLNARETWRKRPLIISEDPNCTYSCGELELAIRLQKAGLKASWVSEWSGFPYVPFWEKYVIKWSDLKSREPDVFQFDYNLRTFALSKSVDLGSKGGHPDLAVLDPSTGWCFLEYKGPGDTIKPKQVHWAETLAAMYPNQIRYLIVKPNFSH